MRINSPVQAIRYVTINPLPAKPINIVKLVKSQKYTYNMYLTKRGAVYCDHPGIKKTCHRLEHPLHEIMDDYVRAMWDLGVITDRNAIEHLAWVVKIKKSRALGWKARDANEILDGLGIKINQAQFKKLQNFIATGTLANHEAQLRQYR